jgi:hypothetical protein
MSLKILKRICDVLGVEVYSVMDSVENAKQS